MATLAGRIAAIGKADPRSLDLRWLAEPIAIASPLALIVSAQEFVMGALAILFLLQSWRARDFSWARENWFVALATLWAYALVRTLLGGPTGSGFAIALHWIHFPLYAAALANWILPEPRARRRLLVATIATVSFFGADCLLQFVIGRDIIGRPIDGARLVSVFVKPGVGIEMSWLILPAALGLWQLGWKSASALVGLGCALAILLAGDRMGLLILLAETALVAVLARPLRKPLLIALPFVAVVAGAALFLRPVVYLRQASSTIDVIEHLDQSPYGIVFSSALAIARDHPAFGVGVRGYQDACLDPAYGPLVVGVEKRCQGHPHNWYLQWLAETGIIGLVLYLAFIGFVLSAILRSWSANAGNLVFAGLVASLALRIWPLAAGTGFYSSWSVEPFFLVAGWTLAYCGPAVLRQRAALSASSAHVSDGGTFGV
jgi:O-antigen ligase